MPWNVVGNALGAQASIINTKQTNEMNYKIAKETNEANRKMVELQNEAAAAESEKAYQRSKAGNQVSLMRAAGMSRAGAINVLNGGGSYTPAPVNVSQDSAPQMQTADVSSLANMGQTISAIFERKHQEKMLDKQLSAQKEENKAQRENAKEIAQISAEASKYGADSSSATARERLEFDKEQFNFNKPKVIAEINQIKQNTEVLKQVAKGHNLENIRKEFENQRLPTLAKLADAAAWQQIEYVAMKLAHENAEHMNKQERESLELEFLRSTMDSAISLQNVQNELQTYLSTHELNTYKDPIVGNFIGAVSFAMEKLVPKFALFK